MKQFGNCFDKGNLLNFILLLEFERDFKICFIKEADVEIQTH